jgi:hypothetical protein
MDPKYINQVDEIYRIIHIQSMRLKELQIEHTVFTWRWWVLLLLTIGPWIIWIVIRRKRSTGRLLFAGLSLSIIATMLDMAGISYGLWSYRVSLSLSAPPVITWNLSLLPVSTMLFLQYKQELSPFIKAVVFSAVGAFIWQPFAVWINVYNPEKWHHYYSFPIFILMYLLAHYIFTRDNFEK